MSGCEKTPFVQVAQKDLMSVLKWDRKSSAGGMYRL